MPKIQSTHQLNNEVAEGKDGFLIDIEELEKNFFKNYWEIEKLVVNKLDTEGSEYFITNNCYYILGKFDSTLEVYCQICEQVDTDAPLLTSYFHLNDIKNVEKQYRKYEESGSEIAYIYKEFYKYKDSENTLESKYISIKFDERASEFANAVFTHVINIEEFITQEWKGLLPPKIRAIFLYSDGPIPYNANLNETYMPVKSIPLSSVKQFAAYIVHETFHLVNTCLLEQKCKFNIEMGMNSFKFLDEGYAQLIESRFMNTLNENREEIDKYSKNIVLDNSFDFYELKTKWIELLSVHTNNLAYSFAYFLDDKYGREKHKALFLPKKVIHEDSWLEYVENYFGLSIDNLIDEWKQQIIQ
ncbi:MAG: hypothetical protein OCD02_06465 [Spirochaetaceae bacterium]